MWRVEKSPAGMPNEVVGATPDAAPTCANELLGVPTPVVQNHSGTWVYAEDSGALSGALPMGQEPSGI